MNPIENVFDMQIAAALLAGAGAIYNGPLFVQSWADTLGCGPIVTVNDPGTDTLCCVAANAESVFVVFRGTRDLRNWLTDLDCRRVPADTQPLALDQEPDGREVHEGFACALASVESGLDAALRSLAPGRRNIILAGHSLGGALAMLYASRDVGWRGAAGDGPQVWVYTFGQPRVGNIHS